MLVENWIRVSHENLVVMIFCWLVHINMQILLTQAHNMQIWSYHDLVLSKAHADIYYHVIVGLLIELSESRLGICNETRHICLQL